MPTLTLELPDEVAARLLADAFAHDAITPFELDQTAEALARSRVFATLVARGYVMPFPIEPVFIYWNATTLDCYGCDQRRSVSSVNLRNRYVPPADTDDPGQIVASQVGHSVLLCRPCIDELIGLGMRWSC